MWRKLLRRQSTQQPLPEVPAGERTFRPAYTPMHGPGAKPLPKPDKSWHPNAAQKTGLAIVAALVLGTGGFFIVNANGNSEAPNGGKLAGRSDSDESAVLGADDYIVPNNADGSAPWTAPTPSSAPTQPANTATANQPANRRATATASNKPNNLPANPATVTPVPAPSPAPTSPTPAPTPAPTPTPTPPPQPTTHPVGYAGGGFKQTALTIKKGDTVSFVHNGNQELFQPVCQVGPVDCAAPNILTTGQAWSYTFGQAGTFVIQNKHNPAETITITVTE